MALKAGYPRRQGPDVNPRRKISGAIAFIPSVWYNPPILGSLRARKAGGIYFEKHSFSSFTRLFVVPFFHLIQLDYSKFGPIPLPKFTSFMCVLRLQSLDFS